MGPSGSLMWADDAHAGHRVVSCWRASRTLDVSAVTRTGLTRQTPPSRSASPSGAQISRPGPDRRTATQVAVSGQVATASWTLRSAGTGVPPKYS